MTIYAILFACALAFYYRREDYSFSVAFAMFILATCLVVGLRGPGVDRDYLGYVNEYILVSKPIKDYLAGAPFYNEPAIALLSSIIRFDLGLDIQWVFIVFAFLGLCLKVEAFRRAAPEFFFAAILIHYSNTLFLHDFTQIRVSVAIGFFLLSLRDIFERRPFRFLAKILLGALFHYSVFIVLPLYVAYGLIERRPALLAALLGGFACLVLVFSLWQPSFVRAIPRFKSYFNTGTINYLNPLVMMRLALAAYVILRNKNIATLDSKAWFYLTAYAMGVGVFYLFHSSAGFGLRFSQIFFSIDPVAIPWLLYRAKPPKAKHIVIAISGCLIVANLYYISIVGPYTLTYKLS